ncbi:hypothetical protein [Nonomuraea jabiensis]|uniref:hypothetical protein n=1 Tax=Nonomuraea jabiensis TaxID=882448 RepID=UPI0036987814
MSVILPVDTPRDGGVHIDPDLPVLAGHYPGFPVFPGVGVLEVADQAIRGKFGADLVLSEIVSGRFLRPVLPGDTLTVRVAEQGEGFSAVVSTERGETARLQVRYRAAT